MSIYVTGDFHGSMDIKKVSSKNWPEGRKLTEDDFLIQLGDLGLVWDKIGCKNDEQNNYWRNWLGEKPYTFCFVDGNHCLSKDTEILTENGWQNIVEVYNEESELQIAQYDTETKNIDYSLPTNRVKKWENTLIHFSSKNVDQLVSHDHHLIINNEKIKAQEVFDPKDKDFIYCGLGEQNGIQLSNDEIRLLTWVIMDGTIINHNKYSPNSEKIRIQFKLSKERKIKKLRELLENMNIKYTFAECAKSSSNKLQPYYIRIYGEYSKYIYALLDGNKKIPEEWRNLNYAQCNVFLETLAITDGHKQHEGIIWSSIEKNHIDIVQEMCVKNNKHMTFVKYQNKGFTGGKNEKFLARIYENKHLNRKVKKREVSYNDYVYCFGMPKGTLIVRRDNKVTITGNCNFYELEQFPIEERFGGKVRVIPTTNKPLYQLLRGEVYNFNGHKCMTLGGAESQDKQWRTPDVSWWKQENWNHAEQEHIIDQVQANPDIEYVFAHTCPDSIGYEILKHVGATSVGTYKEYYEGKCECQVARAMQVLIDEFGLKPKEWHFGHWHENCFVTEKNGVKYQCHYNYKPHLIE